MGFEYFYGFVGGDTSQWQPNLFRNTTPIHPYVGKPGLEPDHRHGRRGDRAHHAAERDRRRTSRSSSTTRPGGTHAPHHPTPEWIEKFSGKFDEGWNELREQIFANQKRLGVHPAGREADALARRRCRSWDALTADEKKLFVRQVEVYAAYLAYTDHEIGRVIQAVEDMGKLDNTLIIYISGDNGCERRGLAERHAERGGQFNGVEVPVADQLKYFYDAWGSDKTYNHMAVGWTWAFDTPYQVDQAGRLAFRRHAQRHGDRLARAASRTRAASATSSTT